MEVGGAVGAGAGSWANVVSPNAKAMTAVESCTVARFIVESSFDDKK
jgi:hypothetical protein